MLCVYGINVKMYGILENVEAKGYIWMSMRRHVPFERNIGCKGRMTP